MHADGLQLLVCARALGARFGAPFAGAPSSSVLPLRAPLFISTIFLGPTKCPELVRVHNLLDFCPHVTLIIGREGKGIRERGKQTK
jgi:hypothetical protein